MLRGNAPEPERSIEERIASRGERIHVLTGASCNNNCIFCMEEDRETRSLVNSQTTDDVVLFILGRSRDCEEVCFTSGEPTLNPRLAAWARWAREHGVRRVSVMTNGRALAYEAYCRNLVAAGMNRFYVSIHGHDAALHQALTRTPGSFEQTVAGIENVARLKRHGVELHTSTVVTKRNLPHLAEIYAFLRRRGVDQVVLNVMQANGRAHTHFDLVFPRYTDVAARAKTFFEEAALGEERVEAYLVDIPLCTTTALPDRNRGYVEGYVHFEPEAGGAALLDERQAADRRIETGSGTGILPVRRSDLDESRREKRADCRRCRYDRVCEGVWTNYLARHGWDEFVPVP